MKKKSASLGLSQQATNKEYLRHCSALNPALGNQFQHQGTDYIIWKCQFQSKWLAYPHQIGDEGGHEVATIPISILSLKGVGYQLASAILKWQVDAENAVSKINAPRLCSGREGCPVMMRAKKGVPAQKPSQNRKICLMTSLPEFSLCFKSNHVKNDVFKSNNLANSPPILEFFAIFKRR